MLISHSKKFIYTKTKKTAGTSVEIYFEKYCMPEGEWKLRHGREEYVSDSGIIGYRGSDSKNKTWWNHMPASDIKNKAGNSIWDNYFKFCVIRNPFEKLVSGYYFFHKQNLTGKKNLNKKEREASIERFRYWLKNGGSILDRDKYIIEGEICVDFFIRYENLHADIKEVCSKLNIPYKENEIPHLKTGVRDKTIPIKEFYNQETVDIVKKNYEFELSYFNYSEITP